MVKSVSEAFDSFSHALRVNTEHLIRAPELLKIDPQEAAGNLDQGLSSILNGFHSIYDAAKDDPRISFAWNREAPTATLLVIRNARHHNHARRIRSLEVFFTRANQLRSSREYCLVTYGANTGGEPPLFVQALSWQDINELLGMPFDATHLSAAKVATIKSYLGADVIAAHDITQKSAVPIFFDVLPLIVNAAKVALAVIEPHLEIYSMEGEGFREHFQMVTTVDTATLMFKTHTFIS
ncbi:hypothetical protein FS799_21830 [Agrobacterium vitis]|uniref:hypothetical protein n=1 Tax=Agrobacterium vitis TaxID=373 RepID=UPI001F38F3C2|nr:hypothetical protein [Agrobacterium vitis]MCE6077490.1 hypothetical protein [Agrobacterium vitis]